MTVLACPYCGAAMNKPLKFCLACGRAVSKGDMKRLGGLKSAMKAGATKRLDEGITGSNFDLSKKSYRVQRNMRQWLMTLSYLLILVLLYYFAVRFVLKEAVPGGADKVLREMFAPPEAETTVPPSSAAPAQTGVDAPAPAARTAPNAGSLTKKKPQGR